MTQRPDQENTQVVKKGDNWTLRVTPGNRLIVTGESFPQQTVHIDLEQPLKDPNTKKDMGRVKISGWVLVPKPSDTGTGAGHTGFDVKDFWEKAKQPLEKVYMANWLRYVLIGAHGIPKDFNLATPGYKFTVRHPRFQGEVIALTPQSSEEYKKVASEVTFDGHCRFVMDMKDESGHVVRKMEYILKSDIVTNPNYLAFTVATNREGTPSLTEASLLWRENGGQWQKGMNSFEVFIGRT